MSVAVVETEPRENSVKLGRRETYLAFPNGAISGRAIPWCERF